MATKQVKLNQIKPSAGYVLIKPEQEEKRTASGIVLPDTHEGERPQQGQVVAVGGEQLHESGKLVSAPCQVGEVVIYKKWGGNEYKLPGTEEEYMFVKFEDVMGVIRT